MASNSQARLWENELGETISNREVEELTKRIRKLSPHEIDLLWYRCGFILDDRDFQLKALSREYIARIKRSRKIAKTLVEALLTETPKHEVSKHLRQIEQEIENVPAKADS